MSEISCRITNTFLRYVKNTKPELLKPLLKDLPHNEDYLMNPDNWISWDVERHLEDRLMRLFNDEMIMFKIGKSTLAYRSLGIVNILANLFMTPERLIRYTPKITNYFTRDLVTINVIETTRQSATVELKVKGKQTRGACLYNQGLFSILTELFGSEAAEISELQCVVPINKISKLHGKSYHIDDNKMVRESSHPKENGKAIGLISDKGSFQLNGTSFGAESCIYKLKWGKKMSGFLTKTAGKKKALSDALKHLEENHKKLETAYERLWKSEANYRSLMENASDIICFIDSDGIITSSNKKGIELSGYSAGQITGQHYLSFVDKAYKRAAMLRFKKALNFYNAPFELIVKTKDRGSLVLSANSSPLKEAGKTVGLMVIARDITKDQEIAARLLEAERFAAKGIVAAEIAHEINNSLANIETALFIVNNIRTDIQYKQDIFKDVYEEIERMSGIVKGILEVYRSDNLVIQSVDINAEITKVIEITKRRLHGRVISVVSELSPDLPSVPCYPGHIKQILLNLIKNAEEAMVPDGKKLITISTAQENGSVNLKIKDTGCGIEDKIKDKVFSHLYTSKKEGSGFGLSICRQIAKKYNGNIKLESEAGKGTTVTVSFPVKNNA